MPSTCTTAKPRTGPGAEGEQRHAGDQRRDVGVEDGGEGALVALVDRDLRRGAVAQFLAHALVDQHVGVDRHAERERDGGEAGQVSVACSIDSTAVSSNRLKASASVEKTPNSR